jgi:hypothetical protein
LVTPSCLVPLLRESMPSMFDAARIATHTERVPWKYCVSQTCSRA